VKVNYIAAVYTSFTCIK